MDNGNTSTHLDKLLEGKPPEFQNKVLRFAYDSGMKPNDPAFQFVQYVGFFAAIAENAPHEWRNLFNDVYEYFQQLFDKQHTELNKWTDLTEEQLKNFHRQTEIIKELAESCNKLGDSLRNLEQISQQQVEQFRALDKLWIELKLLKLNNSELKSELKSFPQHLKPLLLLKEALIPEAEKETLWAQESLPAEELATKMKESFYSSLTNKIQEKLLEKSFLNSLLSKIEELKPKPQRNRLGLSGDLDGSILAVIVVVGLLGFMTLSCLLGKQIGTMQVKGDRDYQQAMEIWLLNRDQLEKARAAGQQKSTIWLVPEYLREKKQ